MLLSLEEEVLETNSYSAFGESLSPQLSPWGYRSKRQIHPNLIDFGRRLYDPIYGRFLTPDPEGFTDSLNLYTYLNNSPLTHQDPFGLVMVNFNPEWLQFGEVQSPTTLRDFSQDAWQKITPFVLDTWNNPRFQGGLQAFSGFAEASFGGMLTFASGGAAAPFGWPVMAHGLDHFFTGMNSFLTGSSNNTATTQLLQKSGVPPQVSGLIDNGLSITGIAGSASAIIRAGRIASFQNYQLPITSTIVKNTGWRLPEKGGGAFINGRWYTEHALERIAPKTPQVMATLEARALERTSAKEVATWNRRIW